jgi:hypothetical protein
MHHANTPMIGDARGMRVNGDVSHGITTLPK